MVAESTFFAMVVAVGCGGGLMVAESITLVGLWVLSEKVMKPRPETGDGLIRRPWRELCNCWSNIRVPLLLLLFSLVVKARKECTLLMQKLSIICEEMVLR